jgi:hypothetical protein
MPMAGHDLRVETCLRRHPRDATHFAAKIENDTPKCYNPNFPAGLVWLSFARRT